MQKIKILVLLLLPLLTNCKGLKRTDPIRIVEEVKVDIEKPKAIIKEETKVIAKNIESSDDLIREIKKEAIDIQKETKIINSITPLVKENTEIINAKAEKIKTNADLVFVLNKQISESNEKLFTVIKELEITAKKLSLLENSINVLNKEKEEVEKEKVELETKIIKMENSALEKIRRIFYIALSICLLISGVGIFLSFYGNPKLGISLIITGAVCASLVWFLINYIAYLAWATVFVIIILVAYLGYTLYRKERTLKEVVKSGEIMKASEWTEETKKKVSEIQSEDTKLAVAEIKVREKIK